MEDYVTFEQAVKLKQLSFNWKCDHWYASDKELCYSRHYEFDPIVIMAPTLAQAQKWLREVKGVIICIEPGFYRNKRPLMGYDYHLFNKDDGWYSHIESKTVYDTYEEALSSGIDKALELLK